VRTLVDAALLAAIDAVAVEEELLPREPSRALVVAIRSVSDSYNALGRDARARRPVTNSSGPRSARLQFFLPRDVGKTYEAARDLLPGVPAGATLRAVDVGAGLGASALGLAMLLRDERPDVRLALTLVDDDGAGLRVAEQLFARVFPSGTIDLSTRVESVIAFDGRGEVDLVLASNVLCELERGAEPLLRADKVSALVHRWLLGLAPGGHVVLVEPALKATARALQSLRARMLAAGFHVVAPCTHAKGCPLLVDEGDWCHEDRAIALPSALIPIARAAGLHYEGLTFAYVILTRAARIERSARARVVAPPQEAKGKRSLTLCHEGVDANVGTATTFERLDRHRGAAHEAWLGAERGSVLTLEPWPQARRLDPDVRIELEAIDRFSVGESAGCRSPEDPHQLFPLPSRRRAESMRLKSALGD
jgi:ribosomal protein RSM22 (predicted rRNA methylase)